MRYMKNRANQSQSVRCKHVQIAGTLGNEERERQKRSDIDACPATDGVLENT